MPGQAFTPQPGEYAGIETLARLLPGGAALTGLRVHRRLRAGSPDRRVK
ncbi:hypothetical protein HMPREF1570_3089, partial [Klebsiella oxytoca KA-2]